MKRSLRHRLLNLFAFGLLAFAIYLTVFYKDEESRNTGKPSTTASTHLPEISH